VLVGEFQSACVGKDSTPTGPDGKRLPPLFHSQRASACPLDPLARQLVGSLHLEELDRRARRLFAAVAGGADAVAYDELAAGLRRLYLLPPVLLRRDQWDELVVRRGLCRPGAGGGEGGEVLEEGGFVELVRQAVRRHQVFEVSGHGDGVGEEEADDWAAADVRRVLHALKARLLLAAHRARRADERPGPFSLPAPGCAAGRGGGGGAGGDEGGRRADERLAAAVLGRAGGSDCEAASADTGLGCRLSKMRRCVRLLRSRIRCSRQHILL
jgi:hypothetical protein